MLKSNVGNSMEIKWKDEVVNTDYGYYVNRQYVYFRTPNAPTCVHLDFGSAPKARKAFDKIWNSKVEKLDLNKEFKE